VTFRSYPSVVFVASFAEKEGKKERSFHCRRIHPASILNGNLVLYRKYCVSAVQQVVQQDRPDSPWPGQGHKLVVGLASHIANAQNAHPVHPI
jgi:hypothetical protein